MSDIEKLTWDAAAEEIRQWMLLLKKAHSELQYANYKEAQREHDNQINLLCTIFSTFRKKAGHDPKDVFKELQQW